MSFDFLNITPLHMMISAVTIFIAYSVKGLSGFGSGLIAIPLLAFLFPLTVIVPVLGLLSYSGARIGGYVFNGYYDQQRITLVLLLSPMLLLGLKIGQRLHDKIDQQKFNKIIHALLSLSGTLLMLKSWPNL